MIFKLLTFKYSSGKIETKLYQFKDRFHFKNAIRKFYQDESYRKLIGEEDFFPDEEGEFEFEIETRRVIKVKVSAPDKEKALIALKEMYVKDKSRFLTEKTIARFVKIESEEFKIDEDARNTTV